MLFIPTYSCQQQILRVLSEIDKNVQNYIDEVVIIDNRSRDNTINEAILASEGILKRLTILRNNQNYNLGGSIKHAFIYALKNNYDYMITLHGDDQADIRDLLPVFQNGQYKKMTLLLEQGSIKNQLFKATL